MKVSIVLGSLFGDCGKGKEVSRLCLEEPENSIVIRFSGGCQAGHTVIHNGLKHVFASFGSGTLQGVPTYWSRFCPVEPVALVNEYKVLKEKGINPEIYLDWMCPLTTPVDIYNNRNNKYNIIDGTCGCGIGATIQRQEDMHKIYFMDIYNETVLKAKISNLLYSKKMFQFDNKNFDKFYESIEFIKDNKIGNYQIKNLRDKHLIFEGSQGILLDQDFGFFPNVTRSNTTVKNALVVLDELWHKISFNSAMYYDIKFDLHYVTRCYQTRHGNGFMSDERELLLKNAEEEINVNNKYQGEFRKGNFDIQLLKHAIRCNETLMQYPQRFFNRHLMINCLDQLEAFDWKVIEEIKNEFEKICYSDGPETIQYKNYK